MPARQHREGAAPARPGLPAGHVSTTLAERFRHLLPRHVEKAYESSNSHHLAMRASDTAHLVLHGAGNCRSIPPPWMSMFLQMPVAAMPSTRYAGRPARWAHGLSQIASLVHRAGISRAQNRPVRAWSGVELDRAVSVLRLAPVIACIRPGHRTDREPGRPAADIRRISLRTSFLDDPRFFGHMPVAPRAAIVGGATQRDPVGIVRFSRTSARSPSMTRRVPGMRGDQLVFNGSVMLAYQDRLAHTAGQHPGRSTSNNYRAARPEWIFDGLPQTLER